MAKVNITIELVGENNGAKEYDITLPQQKLDGHLRYEDGMWWLHVFKSTIKNKNRAFVESTPITGRKKSPNWNDLCEYMGVFAS